MPKTTIWFNGNSGKLVAKKRKRMPGTDSSKRKEVKQCNPMYGHPSDYTAFNLRPMLNYTSSLEGGQVISPWRLHKLLYPEQGANSYQRVGNSIFIKSLRIKGYIYPNYRCIAKPIHWRLKLYRMDSLYPKAANHTTLNDISAYLTLFNNFEIPANFTHYYNIIDACRHNFYKAIKKYPKLVNYSCKTIASGTIPLTNGLHNFGYDALGNTTFKTVGSFLDDDGTWTEDKSMFPLDINIKINDRITWLLDQASSAMTANVFYFIVLEDDFGVGVDVHKTTYDASSGDFNDPYYEFEANDIAKCCYHGTFFARWYYTDD